MEFVQMEHDEMYICILAHQRRRDLGLNIPLAVYN